MIEQIVSEALQNGASEVRMEPRANGGAVVSNVQGVASETTMSREELDAVVRRVKQMTNMDDSSVPQDGLIRVRQNGVEHDIRILVSATASGSRAVLSF